MIEIQLQFISAGEGSICASSNGARIEVTAATIIGTNTTGSLHRVMILWQLWFFED